MVGQTSLFCFFLFVVFVSKPPDVVTLETGNKENGESGSYRIIAEDSDEDSLYGSRPREKRAKPDDKKKVAKMLQLVGRFLAGYKYMGIDHRVWDKLADPRDSVMGGRKAITEFDRPREFEYVKHFPIPALNKLDGDVKKACDEGFLPCLVEIYGVADKSPRPVARREGRMDYIGDALHMLGTSDGAYLLTYRPFKSFLKRYIYRVTASYYMCWFTLNMEPSLKYFTSNCSAVGLDLIMRAHSIVYTHDYRSQHFNQPYVCALISFCPDVCYGNLYVRERVKSAEQCTKAEDNPCRGIGDGTCSLDFTNNKSFLDLMNNKINYTCSCETERKGFEWNDKFKMCVDTDECNQGQEICGKHQVCRNTPGSYYCACDRGYSSDPTGTICREDRKGLNLNWGGQRRSKVTTTTKSPEDIEQVEEVAESIAKHLGMSRAPRQSNAAYSLITVSAVLVLTWFQLGLP